MVTRNKNDSSRQISSLEGTTYITASTTLTEGNEVVVINSDTAMTITLPHCAPMKGRSIHVIAGVTISATITITDKDDSLGWGDITVQSSDTWVLRSNGVSWARIRGHYTS